MQGSVSNSGFYLGRDVVSNLSFRLVKKDSESMGNKQPVETADEGVLNNWKVMAYEEFKELRGRRRRRCH